MPTKCPQCDYPQYCGCWGCRDVIPEGFSPQIITDEGYKCPNCGFEASFDEWELLDYNQILLERQLNGCLKKEEG